ncbi:MAG: imidazolonepropionase [Myxococcota bacterium]
MAYCRLDSADGFSAEPGGLTTSGERIESLVASPHADLRIDASGCSVVPGFVDCHTHLPFAGWRAAEYEMKVTGVPYEEIARKGGGIKSSAGAFAIATDDEVLDQAGRLAEEMLAHGTTSFECKSGYGLTIDAEVRSLRLAAELGSRVPQQTRSTALIAHAIPEGKTAESWLDEVGEAMPRIVDAGASALDVYVESVAFGNDDLLRVGEMARGAGLDLRAHVEQFNQNRSVPVAIEAGARSVDHLARLHSDDLSQLAVSECAAVLLPGAEFLGAEETAPARELSEAGAICVLATDANPGTSPIVSMPLIIGLAVRRYGWSVREALAASTLNASWVLRLEEEAGSIESGKRADLLILDGPIESVPYRFGHNPVACVIVGGEMVYLRPDFESRVIR